MFLIVLTVFAAIGAGTVGAVFAGYNAYKSQLPDASTVSNMEPQIDTDVYDASNQLIDVFHNSGYRHIHEPLADISPLFLKAIVDVEDRHYYSEGSWDLARLVESGIADVTHRSSTVQGGSTITEQLAKISLYGGSDPPQSIDYKIKEIVLGNEIALNFTKAQVLEMYVNRIFYGNFAVGVGSAAEMYFQKPASQLDLAQAAMLAGLPQSPSADNPLNHTSKETVNPAAKSRQKQVLQAMEANGDITQDEALAAYNEKLTFHVWTKFGPEPRPGLRLVPAGIPGQQLPGLREPGRLHHPHDSQPQGPERRLQHRAHPGEEGVQQREHARRCAGEPRSEDRGGPRDGRARGTTPTRTSARSTWRTFPSSWGRRPSSSPTPPPSRRPSSR